MELMGRVKNEAQEMTKNKSRTGDRKHSQGCGARWGWIKLPRMDMFPPITHCSQRSLRSETAQSRKWQMSTMGPVFSSLFCTSFLYIGILVLCVSSMLEIFFLQFIFVF